MFGKKKKVLVLEDERNLARALAIKLEASGFDAVKIENGEDAIKAADKEGFDCAIIDLIIPRIDGYGVMKHIRDKDPDMPIFVLSNLSQKEDMAKAFEYGADKYFIKSNVSLAEICEEVKRVLTE